MKLKRIMLAAPKSGSGKTTLTCGLLQALKEQGEQVVAYKCGPDYIDPMFHQKVLGIPSKNLDTFFTDSETTRELFLHGRKEEEVAVMEGVMGLFDGLGGVREEGSSYHLAQVTKTPIILVVDAKGMGRSILPLLAGFLSYDPEHLIRGVILNRMSKGYYEIVKPLIESELNLSVIGYFPESKTMQLKSRHLGLVMPGEIDEIQEQMEELAQKLTQTISIKKLMEVAAEAEDLAPSFPKTMANETRQEKPVIAVARDEAFCFYYEDNLRILKEQGAELVEFSPLHDAKIPEKCQGLLLGGGYPELYAQSLSENHSMLQSIKTAADAGIPIVAECGGFMYLHSTMTDQEGHSYEMADVVKGSCTYQGKLVRFGYIELEETGGCYLEPGQVIRAHEFHYYDSTQNGTDCIATKPTTGRQYRGVHVQGNQWLGFPHLYYPSNPEFAKRFVEKARGYKREV